MQRKIIALALAGLASTGAHAQSSVNVYGVADVAYVYADGNGFKANTLESGAWAASRLGFKGSEALGNGLNAIFTLEYALYLDANSGVGSGVTAGQGALAASSTAARQQFVGLSSAYGSLTLGRQYAPGYAAGARNNVIPGSAIGSWAVLTAASGSSISANSNARWNNSVAYESKKFGDFTAKAIYGFGQTSEITTPNQNDQRWGLGGNYSAGPLNVDATYHAQQSTTGANKDEWYLGARYDAKVVKLSGSYQSANDKSTANGDNKVWQLGLSVPLGNGTVYATYGELDWNHLSNAKSKSYAIAYSHNLSKRTALYAAFNRTDNQSNASAAGAISSVAARNMDSDVIWAGISHTF